MKACRNDRGSALMIAMIFVLIVSVLTAAYLGLSFSKGTATANDKSREQAFRLAEAGISQALFELNSGRDYDGTANGIGPVATTTMKDGTYVVVMNTTGLTGIQKRLLATGTYDGRRRIIEVVVDAPTTPAVVNGFAAIVSRDSVEFNGNITVDGRDHDVDGNLISGSAGYGVYGVASGGTISDGGAASIGGRGQAPPGGGGGIASGSADENRDWDSDTFDNDRDGTTDESGETFPSDPDQALGVPAGTLKSAAQAAGTYYSSQAAYEAAIAANGGRMLSGKILYCDFTPMPPFELGSGYNTDPSILIVHNSTGDAVAKNVHGDFKGLLFADKIEHINAGTNILGMVHAWGQYGNVFGNGTSRVDYSSAVLANLPRIQTVATYVTQSWREVIQ